MTNSLSYIDSCDQDTDLHRDAGSSSSNHITTDSDPHPGGYHKRVVSVESSPVFDGLPDSVEGSPFVAVDRDVHYTLGDAYDEIRDLSRHHHDRVVSLQDVTGVTVNQIRIGDQTHTISQVAARSLCARLDLPYKYLRSLPGHLQRVNFAHGLQQHRDKEFFVRFDGDQVRGLFSTRYVPIDHVQIIEALLRCGIPAGRRVQLEMDYTLMRLSVVDSLRTFEMGLNDPHTPGISIINSELGLSSFSVAPYVLRLVCTNGLISKVRGAATNFRHVSDRALKQMPQILCSAYKQVGDQQHQLRSATQLPVSDPVAALHSIARQFGLDRQQRDAVTWALPFEMTTNNTLFNIVQTITKAAHYSGLTTEQNTQLQQVGGEVLRLVER
mgnify:CR=1 FL=1